MKSRRPLNEEERAEAARLKAIYERRKAEAKDAGRKFTQDDVAAACGWSGQSAFSQFATGKIPLNISALYALAQALQFRPEEVSPRLAAKTYAGIVDPSPQVGEEPAPFETAEYVSAPYLEEVEAPGTAGKTKVAISTSRSKRLPLADLARDGIDPRHVAWIKILGNSMEMALPHGSSVAIDRSAVSVIDGKIYGIDHSGQLRVKQLYRLPGGGIRMHSFNHAEHRDEEYNLQQMRDQEIVVLGRAFLGETLF